MTSRIYYTDAYRTEFHATIVDRSDDGTRVYLSETAFYPTSGGQQHDLGTLGGVDVVDVVDEDGRIAHVLAAPLHADEHVDGRVDWSRRFDHMQQHTGQHLVSAVFEDLFGFRTVSVHFGPDCSTLDLDADVITYPQLVRAEQRANEIIADARPVSVTFEDAEHAAGLRKASDRTGTLRIVSIDAVDRSACGGTHVRSTAEIGVVLLRGTEKARKATRIEFLCGRRAIRRARRDYETLMKIGGALSASIEDAAALVTAQVQRLKDTESARRKLATELAVVRGREKYAAASPDARGVRTIVLRDAPTMDDAKTIAQAAFALPKVVVVAAIASPPSVLVAASEDSGVDAGKLLWEALSAAGGRGGGSARLAQGSVPDEAALDPIVQQLVDRS